MASLGLKGKKCPSKREVENKTHLAMNNDSSPIDGYQKNKTFVQKGNKSSFPMETDACMQEGRATERVNI